MKIYLHILLLVLAMHTTVKAQEIKWMSLEEAITLQKKTPKKIMMDVYTVWCGPCKSLDKKTFHNPDVVAYVNENYYAVKFNGQGNDNINYKNKTYGNPGYDPSKKHTRNASHELANYLRINAYPTIVFFDENAEVIAPIRGYLDPNKLELYLKLFKNDDHKRITTQEEFNVYYKAFKPVFKG